MIPFAICGKATDKTYIHRYENFYDTIFSGITDKIKSIFEIGVGEPSIKCWEMYFPNAKIYGLDIDKERKNYESARTKIFTGNQTDTKFLGDILKEANDLDVVVDDGPHDTRSQKVAFNFIFPKLKSGAIYIVEDLGYTKQHLDIMKDNEDKVLTFLRAREIVYYVRK